MISLLIVLGHQGAPSLSYCFHITGPHKIVVASGCRRCFWQPFAFKGPLCIRYDGVMQEETAHKDQISGSWPSATHLINMFTVDLRSVERGAIGTDMHVVPEAM